MDNYDNSGMNKADYVMGRLFVDDTKKYLKPETPIFIDDTKNYVDFVNDFVDFSKNAKKNSVRSDDNHFEEKKYSASKHSTDNKKAAKIALGSLLAITVAAGITYGSVRLIDEISIYRSLEPYRSIVTENTYRTEDNQGYWYDTSRIAEGILNQEDVTLAVYGVYNKIGYNQGNKLLQMDLLTQISTLP